jgi:predicted RNA-binding protein with PIN domain
MDETYIVDAYNVVFAWWLRPPVSEDDLRVARRRLTDRVSRFAQRRRARVILVFDGVRPGDEPAGKTGGGVRILWSGGTATADERIRALLAANDSKGATIAVSGDREGVVVHAAAAGARTLSPRDFLSITDESVAMGPESDKPEHASRADVEYWLRRFECTKRDG